MPINYNNNNNQFMSLINFHFYGNYSNTPGARALDWKHMNIEREKDKTNTSQFEPKKRGVCKYVTVASLPDPESRSKNSTRDPEFIALAGLLLVLPFPGFQF